MHALSVLFYFLGAFLLVIAIASVGHDGYIFYLNQDKNPEPTLSMAGFFIEEYALEYGQAALDMIGEENWKNYVDPILQLKTIILFGIPALLLLGLGKICAIIKDRKDNKWARDMNIGGISSRNAKGKRFKYSKK